MEENHRVRKRRLPHQRGDVVPVNPNRRLLGPHDRRSPLVHEAAIIASFEATYMGVTVPTPLRSCGLAEQDATVPALREVCRSRVRFGRASRDRLPKKSVEAQVRKARAIRSIGIAVLLCAFTAATAAAQAVAGSQVSGIIRDTSGGALPGAEVTITKTDTGLMRTTFTGSDGTYALPNLPV